MYWVPNAPSVFSRFRTKVKKRVHFQDLSFHSRYFSFHFGNQITQNSEIIVSLMSLMFDQEDPSCFTRLTSFHFSFPVFVELIYFGR